MNNINLGGVPEHFNYPIVLGISNGVFEDRLNWTEYSTGTGAMLSDVENGTLDAALVLTEGAVKRLPEGFYDIIGVYVKSPLIWGIHTGFNQTLKLEKSNLSTIRYGISRFGSGSELMARVHALTLGETLADDQFTIVNNLPGALEAFSNKEINAFFWEKYTTQPFVNTGQCARIGEFPTPWPCFVLVCSKRVSKERIDFLTSGIRTCLDNFFQLQKDDAVTQIAKQYKLDTKQVSEWFDQTRWSKLETLNPEVLVRVEEALSQMK